MDRETTLQKVRESIREYLTAEKPYFSAEVIEAAADEGANLLGTKYFDQCHRQSMRWSVENNPVNFDLTWDFVRPQPGTGAFRLTSLTLRDQDTKALDGTDSQIANLRHNAIHNGQVKQWEAKKKELENLHGCAMRFTVIDLRAGKEVNISAWGGSVVIGRGHNENDDGAPGGAAGDPPAGGDGPAPQRGQGVGPQAPAAGAPVQRDFQAERAKLERLVGGGAPSPENRAAIRAALDNRRRGQVEQDPQEPREV